MSTKKQKQPAQNYWMVGWHATLAALSSENRKASRLITTKQVADSLPAYDKKLRPEIMSSGEIAQIVGQNLVHQGIALLVSPLVPHQLHEVMVSEGKKSTLMLLDHITDPQNLGAILRSCAAFGVDALITTKDHAAGESAVAVKAACGAFEMVPVVQVTNLASSILELQEEGYWVMGLDGSAKTALHTTRPTAKTALVLGAEGAGLRRLTAERCDELIKLPIHPQMESLNASNAAAVALYQLYLSGLSA
jgi:23S rRNA (guanosine2251-2'-O)-methyltransferase